MRLLQRWRRGVVVLVLSLGLTSGCGESPTAPGSTVVYVALGASDAVGIGAQPLSEGYVNVIFRQVEGKSSRAKLENFGIAGALIDEIVALELPRAIDARPRIVTLWTGSNDVIRGATVDAFAASLDGLLSDLQSRTSATVFVADLADLTKAPMFRNAPDPDVTADRVAAFNARIESVAAARGAVLVRLSAMPIDDSIFAGDGFHPNNAGHRRIADLFWAQIEPRLAGS